MFKSVQRLVSALLLLISPVALEAARVSPMVVDVAPVGRGTSARVTLSNPSESSFPVEARIYRGVITENGELKLDPADDQFLVFPTQMVVKPHADQVFRVQYVGEPDLKQSEIYYLGLNQVPVKLGPGLTGVQVVVNFNVLVNVVPPHTRPEPVVEKVDAAVHGDKPGIEVRLTNRGTKYLTANSYTWAVAGRAADGTEISFKKAPEEVSKEIGVGVVAPGRSRIFFIPTGKPVAEGSATVTLSS